MEMSSPSYEHTVTISLFQVSIWNFPMPDSVEVKGLRLCNKCCHDGSHGVTTWSKMLKLVDLFMVHAHLLSTFFNKTLMHNYMQNDLTFDVVGISTDQKII